jgi:predicted enzyme related to lactoylglutathione lyase
MAGQGSFGWYELSTSDPAAAEAFYKSVVGWGSESFPGEMPYTILTASGQGVAGLSGPPPGGQPSGWTGYVMVDDADATAESIKQAGGAVHYGPDDIPGVGRFAVCADPQGVAFNIMKPGEMERQYPEPRSVGTIGWHELHTTDWEKAFGFYSGQFGWAKAQAMDMGPMGTYQLFSDNGVDVGAMFNSPNMPKPIWLFYFRTDSIEAAIERLKSGGGQVLEGPHEVPGNDWIVQAMDPQGFMFALVAASK